MFTANLFAGWVGILFGMLFGAAIGTGFHRPAFLGGYESWARRLVRLGHISFFGLGFVNIASALSAPRFAALAGGADAAASAAGGVATAGSWLLIAGAVLMPTVCFLSAWRQGLRHLFFLPVASLVGGVACFLTWGILTWTSA